MRRISSLLVLVTLALTACSGGSGGSETADASTVPASDEPEDTAAPIETKAVPDATTAADPTAEPAATSGAVTVSMVEWEIQTPSQIAAGAVTFDVSNAGSFAHHFAIARGDSYETLPQTGGGAIDETALGDDFLGRTTNIAGGDTATIEFDLAPGNYVLFCNIASTVSHAAQGQVLSVTVS